MKGTGAKRNVCPGSCVSTGSKFPVAPVESAPMEQVSGGGQMLDHTWCLGIRLVEIRWAVLCGSLTVGV